MKKMAYYEMLTVSGYRYAYITKAWETPEGVYMFEFISDSNQWLPEVPTNGISFTVVPD